MVALKDWTAYELDSNGRVMPWGTKISDVLNVSMSNDAWYAVTLPSNIYCKYVLVQTRDAGSFLINDDGGAQYFTVPANTQLAINISGYPNQTLFYVKDASGSTTLEVICVD